MLRAVKMLDGAGVPIIGVNVGLLGYLTEVEPPALTTALERWAAGAGRGDWQIEERMMLDATLQRAGRRERRAETLDGAERGRPREAGGRAHRSAARPHRRRAVHVVRRRRADRRHADRLDRLLAVGPRPGGLAEASGAAADAGVAAHAVRPLAGARSRRGGRDRGDRPPPGDAVDRRPDAASLAEGDIVGASARRRRSHASCASASAASTRS